MSSDMWTLLTAPFKFLAFDMNCVIKCLHGPYMSHEIDVYSNKGQLCLLHTLIDFNRRDSECISLFSQNEFVVSAARVWTTDIFCTDLLIVLSCLKIQLKYRLKCFYIKSNSNEITLLIL